MKKVENQFFLPDLFYVIILDMEKYEVILIELETQYEFSAQVEVDEAETSENITILARVGKDEFEAIFLRNGPNGEFRFITWFD